jgi:phospholipase/lecithinase/hemolysin
MLIRYLLNITIPFLMLFSNWAYAETTFNKFVVFGTSLSDPGNYFAETGKLNVAPDYDLSPLGVPESAYAIGGHHMTNGPTWVEQLAKPLGMAGSVLPASRDENPNAMNYAIDGARAAPSVLHGRTLFSRQVNQFLADVNETAPADALYVIEIGSNDTRDAVVALIVLQDFDLAMNIISSAANEIKAEVERLYNAGARNFLYANVPDVMLTPALNRIPLPGYVQDLISYYIIGNINAQLDRIFSGLVNAESTKLDFFGLTNAAVNAPGVYGLINVTDACITPFEQPFKCDAPDNYLFWDVVHPSKAAHGLIAQEAASVLGIN